MYAYDNVMQVLDADGDTVLYRLVNDLFDTVALVYNDGCADEECYLLHDMQGAYPTRLADVQEYDWAPAEEMAE